MPVIPDTDFVLKFEPEPTGTVYLSVSWQPDNGKDFGYRVVRRLDELGYLVVGDTKGFDTMDPLRIQRIMSHADGFLSVLPFRPDKPFKTSSFMIDELRIAISLGLPISLMYDARIAPTISDNTAGNSVVFQFGVGGSMEIPKKSLISHAGYDFGVTKSEDLQLVNLSDFPTRATTTPTRIQPYSFLICRLQADFALPRAACVAAAETAGGIRCLWIASPGYVSNIDDTAERARLLIKNAEFVVAEISLTDENPDFDNPSRAHEIGLAVAYRKKVFPVSHSPCRHPYHGLVSRQLVWWDNESQLFSDLCFTINAERGSVGRHIYNRELERLGDDYRPHFSTPSFDPIAGPHWCPPMSGEADRMQSWVYAVSFGISAGCIAYLLRGFGYPDTLDLAALFAGIVALFFSSGVSKRVLSVLRRPGYLRWLIPLSAGLLLMTTMILWRLTSRPA